MPVVVSRNAPLVGRVLLAVIFIVAGLSKVFDWHGTAGYMAAQGLPAVPALLFLTILTEVGGGVSLLVGFKTRWAAALLFGFLAVVTLAMHPFWGFEGQAQQLQMTMFLKNLAIMGGLGYVVGQGSGPASVDARLAH